MHRIPGHTEHPRRYALCLPPAYARSGALTIRMTPAIKDGRPGRFWRLTVVTHDRWRMSASYAAPGSSSHACRIRSNERITIKSFAVAHAAALKQLAANFPPARVNRQRLQVGRAEWLAHEAADCGPLPRPPGRQLAPAAHGLAHGAHLADLASPPLRASASLVSSGHVRYDFDLTNPQSA